MDWSAQELHIAARLSGDPKLIEIVTNGKDPYISLAVMVGLAPEGATEESNPEARGIGKIMQLAMLYGAGPGLIARGTGMTLESARAFLQRQRQTFKRFFAWSDRKAMRAVTCKPLTTPLRLRGDSIRPGTSDQIAGENRPKFLCARLRGRHDEAPDDAVDRGRRCGVRCNS